jgi:hypothetical protein
MGRSARRPLCATLRHLASGDGHHGDSATGPPPTRVTLYPNPAASATLTRAQKSELYHQGFTVLRNAVPPHLIAAARRSVDAAAVDSDPKTAEAKPPLGQEPALMALLRASLLRPILDDLIDASRGEWWCQQAVISSPEQPAAELTPLASISCAPPMPRRPTLRGAAAHPSLPPDSRRDLHLDGCNAAPLPDGSAVDFVDLAETLAIKPHGATFLSAPPQLRAQAPTALSPCSGFR